jgi:hypothetical protein
MIDTTTIVQALAVFLPVIILAVQYDQHKVKAVAA